MLPIDIQRLRKSFLRHAGITPSSAPNSTYKKISPENCDNPDGYVAEIGRIGLGLVNRYENFVIWRGSGVPLVKSFRALKLQSFKSNKLMKIFQIISIYLVIDHFPLR